jgi:hypothetical protein
MVPPFRHRWPNDLGAHLTHGFSDWQDWHLQRQWTWIVMLAVSGIAIDPPLGTLVAEDGQ